MGKYYLGIDLGGTDIKVGIINEDYGIVKKHSVPTQAHRSAEEVIADMAAAGKAVAHMAGISENDIEHIGIGVPGAVNSRTNIIIKTPNLGWNNLDFIPIFKKHWDMPVFLGNDADAAALAEVYAGAARDYDNVILLTLGTGVGGGFVFDKKIFTGCGFGTEPGHIIIVVDGEPCGCGARGCLEAYASVTGLIREALRIMAEYPDSLLYKLCDGEFSRVNGRIIFDAVKQGDKAAKIIVDDYVKYLGAGIATLCNALRPQAVILGGGVCEAGEPLFGPLDSIVETMIFKTGDGEIPPIIKAELGNDAGIIGAALFGVGN
ncbi:MAG: ROK family protein [Oscillospiraceae bacterium]|nr:ROK family protein [Oscillospiraceae bacterium]